MSHTKVKKNMILGDLGYTPQAMLPLYVRSTLLEKNGTTPGIYCMGMGFRHLPMGFEDSLLLLDTYCPV
jgi:hypothetical protein